MHQIGSGMYVSGPAPDKRKERRLSSGSVATPPYTGGDVSRSGELGRMFDISASSAAASPASSHRSAGRPYSGPLPRPMPSPQLPHSGLLVGPSPLPSPAPSPASGSWRKASRRRASEEAAAATAVKLGRTRLGVPLACYMLVALTAAAGVGVGVYSLMAWHRWYVLVAVGGAVAAVAAVFSWNAWRRVSEAERFFRRFPDSAFDQGNVPVGELIKISGQVTCGRLPLGAHIHDAARCVYTSIRLYEYRGWTGWLASPRYCCFSWELRYSEAQVANFYISDCKSGRRFLVRAGEGAKITPMIKPRRIDIDGEEREVSPNFTNWLASNNLSCNGTVRLKERFIKEGDTASVIGVLKKHHAYDVIDPPAGVVTTSCQLKRCMFPILVEGLILIGNENPDEIVYMV